MRAASRLTGVAFNTIRDLLLHAGYAAASYHDQHVRDLNSVRVQCDEMWGFVYAKQKNAEEAKGLDWVGDAWTWTALDVDSKLIISYLVGGRGTEYARIFMGDLASRVRNRIELTTDAHAAYPTAIESAFGGYVDYGTTEMEGVSNSFVERQNLTMRMSMKRLTRRTIAFSKKVENLACNVALYFLHYNFCRIHRTLRVTPAMEAGLADTVYDMDWVVEIMDDYGEWRRREGNGSAMS